jgi:hypothetical protein
MAVTIDPTRRRLRHFFAGLAASLALSTALAPAHAADPSEFSEAEKLVFVEHQLANVKVPTRLNYSFVKSGSLESGFEDAVLIDVIKVGASGSTVQSKFLSGKRNVKLPDIDGAQANPVILYFLEHDIREMERLTKGKSAYFRKRIRMTLVDEAVVRDTRITYNGNEVDAKEVSVSPYVTDPARSRYERYANKRYTFVLSNAVPGGVYQLRTVMAGAQPSDAPMIEETVTLANPAATRNAAARKTSNQPATSR